MTDFAVRGKNIELPSGRLASFELDIAEVADFEDVLVVRLEIPSGCIMNRNVYAIRTVDAQRIWQVPDRKLVYEDSPYTKIIRRGNAVELFNWDGLELKIDPQTGAVLEERHGK